MNTSKQQARWDVFSTRVLTPGEDTVPGGADIVRVIFLSLCFLILATFLLAFDIIPGERVALNVGDVSPVDIRAPRNLRYESEVLTRAAREQAAQRVQEVYNAPQPQVARRQLTRLRDIIDFIDTVRANPYATPEQKTREIQAIADLALPEDMAAALAAMPEERWHVVSAEALATLRLAMSREIREQELPVVRSNVPLLVDQTRLSEQEAAIVTRIVQALLQPNTFPNPEKTEELRQEARRAVEPVIVEYEAGEIIVREGEVVTEAQVEALDKFGLRRRQITWQHILAEAVFVLLFLALVLFYTYRSYRDFWTVPHAPIILYGMVLGAILLAKVMIPGHAYLPFMYPLAALIVTLGTVQKRELAILILLFVAILLARVMGNSLLLAAHLGLGALIMLLVTHRATRLVTYLWGAVAMVLTQAAVLTTFTLANGVLDLNTLAIRVLLSAVNGIFSAALTLVNFYALGFLFGITTIVQLAELAQPNHPLLQELITKAPGTYHHSLVVGNLAERAAAAIGADPFLTRVGTYYHDIGKIKRPHYFTENQQGDINPHNQLAPRDSASIIISHVADGEELARQYRLPQRVRDFIREHHGTTLVAYFYRKALEAAGDNPGAVNERDFRYPGPKPRSKETAILMLADAVEAIARSRRPTTRQELDDIVRQVILERLEEGQLDEAPLTLHDLTRIRQAFVEMLAGVYHTRVPYPEKKESPAGAESAPAPPPEDGRREPRAVTVSAPRE